MKAHLWARDRRHELPATRIIPLNAVLDLHVVDDGDDGPCVDALGPDVVEQALVQTFDAHPASADRVPLTDDEKGPSFFMCVGEAPWTTAHALRLAITGIHLDAGVVLRRVAVAVPTADRVIYMPVLHDAAEAAVLEFMRRIARQMFDTAPLEIRVTPASLSPPTVSCCPSPPAMRPSLTTSAKRSDRRWSDQRRSRGACVVRSPI